MKINWIKGVWDKGKHNAFTDLCNYKNMLYCCFREATNHVSPDGALRIICLDKSGNLVSSNIIRKAGADLRDPKLSVMPDGKLLLLAYARHYDVSDKFLYSQPICWFSVDGYSWSNEHKFADKNWWLWRVTWQKDKAYGFAYNRTQQSLNLYHGNPRRTFEILKKGALSLKKHGKGYPNESDVVFDDDAKAYAIVRRDADTCSAQLGTAYPPYTQWNWHDLPAYIGGPAMQLVSANHALIAGRLWQKSGPKTALWSLDLHERQLTLQTVLPSAGDTSYPGIHLDGNLVYLSYYSSHENDKSNIYLAQLER